MRDFTSIPVPKKIAALSKDSRGYPIPYIILRDSTGKPHFTINDGARQKKALREKLCPICGTHLMPIFWLVGGPLSAFHPNGRYIDSGMHHECMRYALQVCPYLAAPNYLGRIDAGTVDPSKLPGGVIFQDNTMIPERPLLMVAVATDQQTVTHSLGVYYIAPKRPYLAVEYWRHGEQLTEQAAREILSTANYGDLKKIGIEIPPPRKLELTAGPFKGPKRNLPILRRKP